MERGSKNPLGLRQIVASTDYFRPDNPESAESFRMHLGTLQEGGLSKGEVNE